MSTLTQLSLTSPRHYYTSSAELVPETAFNWAPSQPDDTDHSQLSVEINVETGEWSDISEWNYLQYACEEVPTQFNKFIDVGA